MLNSTFDLLAGRREVLGLSIAAASMATMPGRAAAATRRIDLTNSVDHLRIYRKMSASEEDGAETCFVYKGTTFGVTEGNDVRPLYGMLGFGPVRTFGQPDGSVRFLAREAAVFTDLATGRVLDTWKNPYLDDREVEVWHLRTGAVNLTINPVKPISVSGWKLLRPSAYGTNGFFMPVSDVDGHLVVTLDAQVNRKNPLNPAVWKAESSGARMRYSEHNTWRLKRLEAEDAQNPSPQVFAAWHTIKEWRPWMLMGQRAGTIYNHLIAYKVASVREAPRVLVDYYERMAPEFLTAPTEWTGAYQTDWDHFMNARRPAQP